MQKTSSPLWHALSTEEVFHKLEGNERGLNETEAASRLERYGKNRLQETKEAGFEIILLRQFKSPLIYVLLAALAVSLFLQHWADAIVISIVLALNAGIGSVQEYQAENAIQALKNLVSPKASVLRDGKEKSISTENLVPGDIVRVKSGDSVPAEIRIFQAKNLKIDEAALTGESVPVTKQLQASPRKNAELSEQSNMLFMGTAVTSGHALGIVVATGEHTQVGAIAQSIREVEEVKTPLQKRMERLAKWIAAAVVLTATMVFAVGLWMGKSLEEVFLLAVALAVSVMPEGLPVVMTVALAVGVKRMAARKAVIRHLPAVETLGSTSVIVSDKTGTLTQNRMTVKAIESGNVRYEVSGAGLDLEGKIEQGSKPADIQPESPLYYTLLAAVLNNQASLQASSEKNPQKSPISPEGDPMEVAFLIVAEKAGMPRGELAQRYPQIDEVPFETERRFSATLHRDSSSEKKETLVLVKGAPERILEMCDRQMTEDGERPLDRESLLQRSDAMAAEGLRVLAMAIGRGTAITEQIQQEKPSGLIFAGFQGLLDPPRPEVAEAVEKCHAAGIRAVICTGDHANTAAAIAARIHLASAGDSAPETMLGKELDLLSPEELREKLQRVSVFARVNPQQKLKIVNSFKDAGEVVAVTGDGVNDAPALKSAHLGVAMGVTGTDVAKGASQMVLTDDNFASIYAAVEEGRTTFRNIRMATFFLVSSAAGEVLIILASLLLAWPLPFLPAQILWLNVVTNGIEDVSLAFEPGDAQLFQRPPRPLREGVLNRLLFERTLLVGILFAAVTLLLFWWELNPQKDNLAHARSVALTTLVVFQIFHVFNCRSEHVSIFKKSLLSNKILFFGVIGSLSVHVAALYFSPLQRLLGLAPLTALTWLKIIPLALSVIFLVEIDKYLRTKS